MSDAIDTAVTKLTNAIEAGIKAAGALGEKYGPEVVDAGLWVVRLTATKELVWGAVFAIVAGVLLWHARRFYRWCWKESGDSDGLSMIFGGGGYSVVMSGFVIASMHRLLDIWNWAALFEPKLWVAKRLLGL